MLKMVSGPLTLAERARRRAKLADVLLDVNREVRESLRPPHMIWLGDTGTKHHLEKRLDPSYVDSVCERVREVVPEPKLPVGVNGLEETVSHHIRSVDDLAYQPVLGWGRVRKLWKRTKQMRRNAYGTAAGLLITLTALLGGIGVPDELGGRNYPISSRISERAPKCEDGMCNTDEGPIIFQKDLIHKAAYYLDKYCFSEAPRSVIRTNLPFLLIAMLGGGYLSHRYWRRRNDPKNRLQVMMDLYKSELQDMARQQADSLV